MKSLAVSSLWSVLIRLSTLGLLMWRSCRRFFSSEMLFQITHCLVGTLDRMWMFEGVKKKKACDEADFYVNIEGILH